MTVHRIGKQIFFKNALFCVVLPGKKQNVSLKPLFPLTFADHYLFKKYFTVVQLYSVEPVKYSIT